MTAPKTPRDIDVGSTGSGCAWSPARVYLEAGAVYWGPTGSQYPREQVWLLSPLLYYKQCY